MLKEEMALVYLREVNLIVMRKMKTLKMLRLLVVEKSPEVHLQFLKKSKVNQR